MAEKGLNKIGREYVTKMIQGGASNDKVGRAIDSHVRNSNWDYDQNLKFLQWLRSRGLNRLADYLARYMDG